LVLGKPVGVLTFSWLAVRLGLAIRTTNLSWSLLAAGAFLTGIGFTMSLFIASLAYSPAALDAAKFGIPGGSTISAVIGLGMLVVLTSRGRIAHR
jgi:NhaA family Na+:H+ antiporter